MTKTKSFGTGKRESHDASTFYNSKFMGGAQPPKKPRISQFPSPEIWANNIICSSNTVFGIPEESIALAFTSPPYNVGKDYDLDMTMGEYEEFIFQFGRSVYKYLIPGGRYIINVANLGRSPYIPMTKIFYEIHLNIGFLPAGEIIWKKGEGISGSCAWGSWKSAKAPRIRDLHEYLLIFCKESYTRADTGISTISKEDFLRDTTSIWTVRPESAKKIGHPAPFPIKLAERVINLYTYKDDVILDPFVGSGTTCVAAKKLGRYYIGVDNNYEYCQLALQRLKNMV